jgi:hypothetical protein
MLLLPPINQAEKEVSAMEWQFIVALVIAIPVILFPAAFVWYINIGGIVAAIRQARARRAVKGAKSVAEATEWFGHK